MKTIYIFAALLLTPLTSSAADSSADKSQEAIAAFGDICLKTAPSFSGALQAAKDHRVNDIFEADATKWSGFTADKSLGVQLKVEKSCVITTPSLTNEALTKQFLAAIEKFLGVPVGEKVPVAITIQNQSFAVMHDRSDGEAFVLLRRASASK